jgi:hypothetical protein
MSDERTPSPWAWLTNAYTLMAGGLVAVLLIVFIAYLLTS